MQLEDRKTLHPPTFQPRQFSREGDTSRKLFFDFGDCLRVVLPCAYSLWSSRAAHFALNSRCFAKLIARTLALGSELGISRRGDMVEFIH